jgi:hypothetical protein
VDAPWWRCSLWVYHTSLSLLRTWYFGDTCHISPQVRPHHGSWTIPNYFRLPTGCLLANLVSLHLTSDLKPRKLIFLCNKAWPQYPLDNASKWPLNGNFNPNILRDLYNFCERAGKWKELSYAQSFPYLCIKPSLCTFCSPVQILLVCKPVSKSTNSSPKPPPSPCKQTSCTAYHASLLLSSWKTFPVMELTKPLLANSGLKENPALGELMLHSCGLRPSPGFIQVCLMLHWQNPVRLWHLMTASPPLPTNVPFSWDSDQRVEVSFCWKCSSTSEWEQPRDAGDG